MAGESSESGETDVLTVHRQVLRAFREASSDRGKLEQDNSDGLATDLLEIDGLVAEAREGESQAVRLASSVGIAWKGQVRPTRFAPQDANSGQALARSVAAALEAAAKIKATSRALQQHRRAAAGRRLAIRLAAVVGILMVLGTSIVAYRGWDTERVYQSSIGSVQAARWDDARRDLEQVSSVDSNYKDTQVLLRETYIHLAVAALEAGAWDKVGELQQPKSGRSPLDGPALSEAYYQAATATLATGNVDNAAAIIVQLNKLSPAFRDIPQVVASKSDLRKAIAARYVERWVNGVARESRALAAGNRPVRAVKFSPDGRMLLSAGPGGVANLWDIASGKEVRAFQIADHGDVEAVLALGRRGFEVALSNGMALSPDGKLLAAPASGLSVGLWDVGTGKLTRTLNGTDGDFLALAFSPDGTALAATSLTRSPKTAAVEGMSPVIWSLESDQQIVTAPNHDINIRSMAFSPDGRIVAAGGSHIGERRGSIVLWDSVSGREVASAKVRVGTVWEVAFSEDGTLLASCTGDGLVLWDAAARNVVWEVSPPKAEECRGVDFSADGSIIASASDGTIGLWNTADGRKTGTVNIPNKGGNSVAFSADASMLAATTESGVTYLWSVR